MPFIGNQPAEAFSSFQKQDFTTSATTSYTLDHPVANGNEIALFINFVRQEPTAAYTASGTSLTLTSATTSSDDMYCVYLGKAVQTVNPPNGSVGTAQIADSSVSLAKLSATGTKDSTTFLRGDNTFAEVSGGVIQTKYLLETATYSAGSTSFIDLGSLSLSITPTSASNKILVHVSIGRATSSDNTTVFRFTRNGTVVGVGDTVGSRIQMSFGMLGENYSGGSHGDNHSFTFIDEPSSTSALTYKLQQANEGGGTSYYNRAKDYLDNSQIQNGTAHTTFILQEIVA